MSITGVDLSPLKPLLPINYDPKRCRTFFVWQTYHFVEVPERPFIGGAQCSRKPGHRGRCYVYAN